MCSVQSLADLIDKLENGPTVDGNVAGYHHASEASR